MGHEDPANDGDTASARQPADVHGGFPAPILAPADPPHLGLHPGDNFKQALRGRAAVIDDHAAVRLLRQFKRVLLPLVRITTNGVPHMDSQAPLP